MSNLFTSEMVEKQSKRINTQNMALLKNLKDYFGEEFPIFMDSISEEELPKDVMNYIVIETGNYANNDAKARGITEDVSVTFVNEQRHNPTLDRLAIMQAGLDVKLRFSNSNNDTMVLDTTNRIIGVFTATFTRAVLSGCM